MKAKVEQVQAEQAREPRRLAVESGDGAWEAVCAGELVAGDTAVDGSGSVYRVTAAHILRLAQQRLEVARQAHAAAIQSERQALSVQDDYRAALPRLVKSARDAKALLDAAEGCPVISAVEALAPNAVRAEYEAQLAAVTKLASDCAAAGQAVVDARAKAAALEHAIADLNASVAEARKAVVVEQARAEEAVAEREAQKLSAVAHEAAERAAAARAAVERCRQVAGV